MEKDFHLSICLRSAKGYRKDKEKLVKFLSRDTQEDQAVCSLSICQKLLSVILRINELIKGFQILRENCCVSILLLVSSVFYS